MQSFTVIVISVLVVLSLFSLLFVVGLLIQWQRQARIDEQVQEAERSGEILCPHTASFLNVPDVDALDHPAAHMPWLP